MRYYDREDNETSWSKPKPAPSHNGLLVCDTKLIMFGRELVKFKAHITLSSHVLLVNTPTPLDPHEFYLYSL